jgi:hypothetical protein
MIPASNFIKNYEFIIRWTLSIHIVSSLDRFRGSAFKRKIKAALRRADLQEFHVMECAGTQLGRLLCPSRIDGPPVCNRQCWFCAGREDGVHHRQVCKRSMAIYLAKWINCRANQRSMYVGQTTRRFSKRRKEIFFFIYQTWVSIRIVFERKKPHGGQNDLSDHVN